MSTTIRADPAYWAELVTTALLGTDRRVPDELTEGDPSVAVLRQAAGHRVVALLGAPSVLAEALSREPTPDQQQPEAPPAADRLLTDLLRSPDPALISYWLNACATNGRTIHPVHWTRLARLAAHSTTYDRSALGAAFGARGRWFLQQNPDWRKLATDAERPPAPSNPDTPSSPDILSSPDTSNTPAPTAQDVLLDPDAIFDAPRPWGPELVSAAYAVLGGEGHVPPSRTYPTRLGVALPTAIYPTIAKAGEYYVLMPDASPARRRTIRDRFVALELAAYARAAIDHAFTGDSQHDQGQIRFTRAEIPHV